jgi:rhodanese-related sulfurtransferase
VLDVRRPGEWAGQHLEGATHIPLSQLPVRLTELDRTVEWVTVCAGGYRSSIAASVLERAGFARVVDGAGGMDALARAGRA